MSEEIKEILKYYQKDIDKFEYYMSDYNDEQLKTTFSKNYQRYKNHKILLNYITNLQKENEKLKEENKRIFSRVNDDELLISNAMNYAELQDYKSRNKKAVEYIKSKKAIINTDYIRIFDLFEIEEQGYTKDLLNILEGGDE